MFIGLAYLRTNMKLSSLLLLSILTTLSGCAAFEAKQHYTGEQAGYVSSSIGITKNSAKSPFYRINIKQKEAPFQEYWVGLNFENMWGDTLPDISDDKKEVVVFAKRLEPGNYSITEWQAEIVGGNITFNYRSRKDFNIDFEVKDGEITYLDQMLFHTIWQDAVFGLTKKPGNFLLVGKELTDEEKSLTKVRIQEIEKTRLTKG